MARKPQPIARKRSVAPTKRTNGTMPNIERMTDTGHRHRDVILCRISVDRDNETSTETQEDECRAFSAMFNGDVVHVEIERGKSAYKRGMRRPGLERCLKMLERGEATRLIVWKLDRLMRDVHDFSRVLLRMAEANVHLVSRTEPWIDTTSPMGYAIVHIIAAVAEIESINKSDRQASHLDGRHKAKDENGHINPLVPCGRPPFGYDKPRPNVLVINKREQKVLHEIAARIVTGESLRSIANDLNARGITTKAGARWTHTALHRAVGTPTVIGYADRNGTLVPSTRWQPILDVDTYNRIAEIVSDPSRDANNGALKGQPMTIKHMLAGVMRCGVPGCGHVMRPTGKNNRLACTADGCRTSVYEDQANEFVSAYLLSMVSQEDWELLRARGRTVERKAMTHLTGKLEHARKAWLLDQITDAEWDAVQRDVAELTASLAESEALDIPEWESLAEGWATATPEDQRTIITTVFESITVVPRAPGCNGTQRIKILNRKFDAETVAA